MKKFQSLKNSIVLNPSSQKMVSNGFGNEKIFNQCWLGLKQPKICEKCHCYGTFKPLFSILTRLGNFQIKGGESGDVGFFTSKYEKTHVKVH